MRNDYVFEIIRYERMYISDVYINVLGDQGCGAGQRRSRRQVWLPKVRM